MAIHRRIRQAAKDALSAHRSRSARKAARPGKGRALARDPEADRIDQRLSALAAKVLAGDAVECAWELFRVQYFPGWEHEDVAAALGLWATRTGVKVTFESHEIRGVPVIWVRFGV
jgi:hypothetical protein